MPAQSEKQRKAAGMALAAIRGKVPRRKLTGAAKSMAEMHEAVLKDFARKPKRGVLPA